MRGCWPRTFTIFKEDPGLFPLFQTPDLWKFLRDPSLHQGWILLVSALNRILEAEPILAITLPKVVLENSTPIAGECTPELQRGSRG
jgi:hypothetical protein